MKIAAKANYFKRSSLKGNATILSLTIFMSATFFAKKLPLMKWLLPYLLLCISFSSYAQPRLPKDYYWKKLNNGLEIVVIENAKVPLATIEIAVQNGAYTESPEYPGVRRYLELNYGGRTGKLLFYNPQRQPESRTPFYECCYPLSYI